MNFQKLLKVESYQTYLDFAFNSGKKQAELIRETKFKDKLTKSKNVEIERISVVRNTLNSHLGNILKSFPTLDDLPPFYLELVRITLDYGALKRSLGAVLWALKKLDYFYEGYKNKIKHISELSQINDARRDYYGRVSSVMKQIKNELEYLEEARKIMKGFPMIKTSVKTVCIFGFPNVGKSTLLSKITGSTPEIKNYAFTTKSLNIGYLKNEDFAAKKIQFIDTPGTLDRFFKMNLIEQQAYLALKHCCDGVIFVFDLTECYSYEKQFMLFENLKKIKPDTPIIVYLSKSDMINKTDKLKIETFVKQFKDKYKVEAVYDKDVVVKKVLSFLDM
ncbi:50S ribosome-binding GTPase [Candidatus Woesearchaeota archaeon]|nr:50S ribosome-binding GTPase [Candidatus Woesearchaeota archaeon]